MLANESDRSYGRIANASTLLEMWVSAGTPCLMGWCVCGPKRLISLYGGSLALYRATAHIWLLCSIVPTYRECEPIL